MYVMACRGSKGRKQCSCVAIHYQTQHVHISVNANMWYGRYYAQAAIM